MTVQLTPQHLVVVAGELDARRRTAHDQRVARSLRLAGVTRSRRTARRAAGR